MHRSLAPIETTAEGLVEQAQDSTAPHGLVFYHANEGRPLATPWQVAALRAGMVSRHNLPDGWVVDCACGSGIQLAAYGMALKRPVLGVELAEERARASAVNVRSVVEHSRGSSEEWYLASRIISGDGTDAVGVLKSLDEPWTTVAFLHLDPARPRNSRTHALEEMQPPLHSVLTAWAPHFASSEAGPAVLLDLSPRLTATQRAEVETIVDSTWPGVARTWEWTSRGRGRVDRLALWLGGVADPNATRRFVRVPPSMADQPVILRSIADATELSERHHPPQRNEYVSILDAALLESGLMVDWLERVAPGDVGRWATLEGRRPQLHHEHPLNLQSSDHQLVQATGRVVELLPFPLDETTVDQLVAVALEHRLSSVKLRFELDPALQPKLQGSLDRQLKRRRGGRVGFVARHPHGEVLLLCVSPNTLDEPTPI
ncbi:MAG: hypothetical protein ACO3NY_04705 [Poseidonia sp.]